MKACKSKIKVPKKAERIAGRKDVIEQNFIALFGEDYRIVPENLYTLFEVKIENNPLLKLDLHNGKLYLEQDGKFTPAEYYNMPYYLKNGGKGAGKYKHLSEKNWQRLTDREKAEQLEQQRHPMPLLRTCSDEVSPPDVEAYYIRVFDGKDEKCVYLRNVGEDAWRVFCAKSAGARLQFDAYACSEHSLKEILTGNDRRSKNGQIDCFDRFLSVDEVKYVSAFMPNVHEKKRPKALAVATDESETLEVIAYYWKGGKSVACADEEYIVGLFTALEEIAVFSVELEVKEEGVQAEIAPEEAEVQELQTEAVMPDEEAAEVAPLAEETPAEVPAAAEEVSVKKESVVMEDVPAEKESPAITQAEELPPEEAKSPETPQKENEATTEVQKPVERKRGLFSRRKKKEKEAEAAQIIETEPAVQSDSGEPALAEHEDDAETPISDNSLFEETAQEDSKQDIPPEKETQAEIVVLAEEAPAPGEETFTEEGLQAEETAAVEETSAEEDMQEEEAKEETSDKVATEETVPEEEEEPAAIDEILTEDNPVASEEILTEEAEETADVEQEPAKEDAPAPIPTSFEALVSEIMEVPAEDSEKYVQQPGEEAPEEAETKGENSKAAQAISEVEQPPLSEQSEGAQPGAVEQFAAATKRRQRAAKQTKVRFDLAQLVSAYTVAGRKKNKVKEQIVEALPYCPLIVPISAENYYEAKTVFVSKKAAALCGDKIAAFTALEDKEALLPSPENADLREGVMVKTVVSRTKAYIPVFADFNSAAQIFGTGEKFGIFTLENLLLHISKTKSVSGISLHPGTVNIILFLEDFEQKER